MATTVLIISSLLMVWVEASGSPLGGWFGAKLSLLPPLMVYAGLTFAPRKVAGVGILGGVLHDSLSVGPLGLSIFPLCLVGLALNHVRAYLYREEFVQQLILGGLATFVSTVVELITLALMGIAPAVSIGLMLKIMAVAVAGAVVTPLVFRVLDWLNRLLGALPAKYQSPSPAWSFNNRRRYGPSRESTHQRAYK